MAPQEPDRPEELVEDSGNFPMAGRAERTCMKRFASMVNALIGIISIFFLGLIVVGGILGGLLYLLKSLGVD